MNATRRRWFQRLDRPTLVGLIGLALLAALALFAPLLAPTDPTAQPDPVALRFLPPLYNIHSVTLRTGERVYGYAVRPTGDGGVTVVRGRGFGRAEQASDDDPMAGFGGTRPAALSRTIPATDLAPGGESGWHQTRRSWLGTDGLGRDLLSRLLYGARVSLLIGFVTVIVALGVGITVGAVAGYAGGRLDAVLMRAVDTLMAFPRLFLVLLVVAFSAPTIPTLVLTLGLTGWTGTARLVRAEVLSLREGDFVQAAQALGLPDWRIVFRHILPNAVAPAVANAMLLVGNVMLVEAALSFLGLGVQPPTPSWGTIIADGRDSLGDGWWISTLPGLLVTATVVSLNLLGDGLRDVLDPRIRPT